jgi:phospholipid-binding lipoprotein MlaA
MKRNRQAPRGKAAAATAMLGIVVALQGCATPQNRDPLEPLNRKVFGFNEAVDATVVKPLAKGYTAATPEPVRTGIGNFINNIKDVWSAVNLLLQGRGGAAAQEVLRVGLNSTFGMAGFIDIATPMQLDRHNEDLGQTLGVWGFSDGGYLVLPFMGPSTVRDALALPFDQYVMPSTLFQISSDANAARLVQVISARAQAMKATDLLADVALDKYAFVRDAYLQRRRNLIYNGDPPDEQTLWQPDVAPSTVVWQAPLNIEGPMNGQMVLPSADERQALWMRPGLTLVSGSAVTGGVVASTQPVPMGEPPVQVVSPTAEEMAGLRADEDAR